MTRHYFCSDGSEGDSEFCIFVLAFSHYVSIRFHSVFNSFLPVSLEPWWHRVPCGWLLDNLLDLCLRLTRCHHHIHSPGLLLLRHLHFCIPHCGADQQQRGRILSLCHCCLDHVVGSVSSFGCPFCPINRIVVKIYCLCHIFSALMVVNFLFQRFPPTIPHFRSWIVKVVEPVGGLIQH